jgi:sensor histidine kinase YesM
VNNLKLYVDLEKSRIEKPIDFDVNYSKNIEPDFDEIPALLLQPFVENAIIHGLTHKRIENPKIELSFFIDGEFLCISIKDNGIGRKAAGIKKKPENHMGIATKIAESRIHFLNQELQGLQILDLYDEKGEASGTEVVIKIKNNNINESQ